MKDKLKIPLLSVLGIGLMLFSVSWSIGRQSKVLGKEVILSLSSPKASIHPGETFTVQTFIQSEKQVIGADLFLNYDSRALALEKITPGDFFPEPVELSKGVKTDGKIFYAIGSFTPTAGRGSLASFIFKSLRGGKRPTISFGQDTQLAVQGGGKVNLKLINQ